MFVNKKQLSLLLVNCFVLGKYRDVTKISNSQVKLSRWEIRQLGISLGYIFLLFPGESIWGKILAAPFNDSPGRSDFLFPQYLGAYLPPPTLDVSVPLPSLLPCAHSSTPEYNEFHIGTVE